MLECAMQKKRSDMTPEQLDQARAYGRAYYKEWRLKNLDREQERGRDRYRRRSEADREVANARQREYARAHLLTPEQREKQRQRSKEWPRTHRERHTDYMRAYYRKNRDRMVLANRTRSYGVPADLQLEHLAAQEGVCAICKKPETAVSRRGLVRSLNLDHDHATGKMRGFLCSHCNRLIGGAFDSPAILRAAADYLERTR